MIEDETEGSVTASRGRREGIVQVRLAPPQDDVARELRDVRAQHRRPARVDRETGRIEGQKAEISTAKSLSHDLGRPARIGHLEHQRDVVERGLEHRKPVAGPGNFRSPVQPAAEERHAAELDPRRGHVVQAQPQDLRHPALLERSAQTLGDRAHFFGSKKPLVARQLSGLVVEWRGTR